MGRSESRCVIRRRRRLTILLRPTKKASSPVEIGPEVPSNTPSPDAVSAEANEYSIEHLMTVCKNNWSRWTASLREGRMKAIELVTQYPTSSNVAAMLDLEAIIPKMEQVGPFFISKRT